MRRQTFSHTGCLAFWMIGEESYEIKTKKCSEGYLFSPNFHATSQFSISAVGHCEARQILYLTLVKVQNGQV